MEIGISTASLFMRQYNEEAVRTIAGLGVNTCEIFLETFCEYNREYGETLARNKGALQVNSVHLYTTHIEPQLFSDNERTRADAYYFLDKAMDAANAFGAKYYTFHGTARYKKASRSGKNDNFQKIGETLERTREVCEKHGVALSLETVEWSTYNRPGVFKEALKRCPGLFATLDIKQTRLSEYPENDYIEETAGHISHVHLSDINEEGKTCLPGRGAYNFADLFLRLSDAGFNGAALIEAYKDDYVNVAELKTSAEYLQEILYKYNLE
ncbi:MAG: sugar phosphate isomerase/epimerase [Candidatus Borkfalkiaceae bacterium]|nr:sugar phosphate isomerase/epimerase [Clostridia bacterium]MDY6222773.1 sugar phosphate isomerase/epimerase [Christensenellaceae bacterium]